MEFPIRINHYLALKQYCSRRMADKLIAGGKVKINGKVAAIGQKVNEADRVEVDLPAVKKISEGRVYLAYHKPVGIDTHAVKFKNHPGVFPIGRLDKNSHGLILMTNDGRVTDRMLSPLYVHEKEYVVKVEPNFSDKFIELMGGGVHFDKFISRKCKVWRNTAKSKDTFNIVLTEGKKRQIRRMCEALHHKVVDLKRIRIMNIELGKLNEGEYRDIKGAELDTLLKSLKLR